MVNMNIHIDSAVYIYGDKFSTDVHTVSVNCKEGESKEKKQKRETYRRVKRDIAILGNSDEKQWLSIVLG